MTGANLQKKPLRYHSIVWGKDVTLPTLPISEYVDTEISTNIVLGTAFQIFREINIEVLSSKGIR